MSSFAHHQGSREIQDRFDTRRLADKLTANTVRATIDENARDFIRRMDMFFLASVDAQGNVDCSYKGGEPGFVHVLNESTIAFPNYDGNGQFMSAGNIRANGKVGLLFIDWENQRRMRLNGTASIDFDDALAPAFPGAQFVVRVQAEEVFPNCPRYIHRMQLIERSVFVPGAEHTPPEPDWKDHFEDVLPEDQRHRRREARGRRVSEKE